MQPKSNVVKPAKESRTPVEPGSVALEVRPGATTTLLTKRATPPAHQLDGQPKIAADPNHVDHTTLLPKRGPQASTRPARRGRRIALRGAAAAAQMGRAARVR